MEKSLQVHESNTNGEKYRQMTIILPEEIVCYNILSRLPTKSFLRIRFACKRWWYKLAKDPYFLLSWNRHHGSYRGYIATPKTFNGSESLSFLEKKENCGFEPILQIPIHTVRETVRIVASCNGLLCFAAHPCNLHPLIVYNPITKQSRKLPTPKFEPRHATIHLGFDRTTNKFKIVQTYYPSKQHYMPGVDIFSLGDDDSWRTLELPNKDFRYKTVDSWHTKIISAFFEVELYCLVKPLVVNSKHILLVLNVGKEIFRHINLPESIQEFEYDSNINMIVSSEASVALIRHRINTKCWRIWKLVDSTKGSWSDEYKCKLLSVYNEQNCTRSWFKFIDILSEDNFLVMAFQTNWAGANIHVCNNNTIKELVFSDLKAFDVFPFEPNLALLQI